MVHCLLILYTSSLSLFSPPGNALDVGDSFLSNLSYTVGVKLCDVSQFENLAIAYERGEMTLRFREYSQTLKLFKKVDAYGEHNVVASSSAWFEVDQTIKCYYLMLSMVNS